MWGCFLMSGVKILHFLKDWWKSIPIHQNYTMALTCDLRALFKFSNFHSNFNFFHQQEYSWDLHRGSSLDRCNSKAMQEERKHCQESRGICICIHQTIPLFVHVSGHWVYRGVGGLTPHFGRYVPRQSEKLGAPEGARAWNGGLRSWLVGRVWLALWPAANPGLPERWLQ